MGHREDVQALEALTPWDRPAFRAGLAVLSDSVAEASRVFAADVGVLAALAAQVPRCARDEVGATPWTSLRQEVAVARRVSGQAAARELRTAVRLTSVLPRTLHLLEAGVLTVARAQVFVDELEVYDDELAGQLDTDLAEVVAGLAAWRIRDEVRRAVLVLDPDAAAVRTAAATAQRDVTFEPLSDGQACVVLTGPAVPLTRWYTTLDARARALRAAGDPRNLAALRFDLAASTFPCITHPPADQGAGQAPALFGDRHTATATATATAAAAAAAATAPAPAPTVAPARATDADATDVGGGGGLVGDGPGSWHAPAGLRPSGVEAGSVDCRMGRPVQAVITVPVETALGLSNEPAWLDGYGWLDGPASRLLLPDAELRRLSIDGRTGQVLDLAARGVRPPPTPAGVRQALQAMTTTDTELSSTGWRTEPDHDPSGALSDFVVLRDRTCDGPTQPRSRAGACDLDHTIAHPHGPTAAWNLAARSRRTHQLKHYGWDPVRTATGTTWTSPAGQVIDVPVMRRPAPGTDPGDARLPDPDQLHSLDTDQHTPTEQHPPVVPPQPRTTATPDADGPPPW